MKLQELLIKIFKRFESRHFDGSLKIVRLMGTYAGYSIFQKVELRFWEKSLVRFLQLITLTFTTRMAWSAYYCRHDFFKCLYYLILFMNAATYSCFQFKWINREDKLDKLLKWCQRQSEEPVYLLLDKWPENYYNCNRFARSVLMSWITFINIWSAQCILICGPILISLYFQEYFLFISSLATWDGHLNFWTFTTTVIEESIYFFTVSTCIGVNFVTFYFTAIYLSFRLNAIEELIGKLAKDVTDGNKYLDRDLLKFIIELQVDANE